MKRIATPLFFVLFFLVSVTVLGQTTYSWIGGNGSWNVAGNWSPTRTTPAATDIIQFNDGGTYTVTAVPTQTIRQLLVTNNSNITLQTSAANQTLSINGPGSTDNIVIANGSSLTLGSATATFTVSIITTTNQRGDISGSLTVNANNAFTTSAVVSTIVTVSGTGVVNHYGGTITGSAATLNFAANSNYNYLGTGLFNKLCHLLNSRC